MKSISTVAATIVWLIVLIISTAATTWIITTNNPMALLLTLPVLILSGYKIVAHSLSSIRKVTFMFNAIDCDDYTFKFTQQGVKVNDQLLNRSLNRMKEIMINAKLRTIEREKYYQKIIESAGTAIITFNQAGNIYQVNSEAKRLLGMEVLTHINQLAKFYPSLVQSLRTITSGEKTTVTTRNERGEVQLSLTASAIDYDGKELKIVAISDIAGAMDAKETESWIKLTRVLTHEIMNSLAPITSLSTSLMEYNSDKDGQLAKGLATIASTSRSLVAFVESYRKFTRIQQPQCSTIDLRELTEQTATLICPPSVTFAVDFEPDEILVWADRNLISQVVVNLVKNAVEAVEGRDNATITMVGRIDSEQDVVIDVVNNGPCIPNEVTDNIFLPFYTTKQQGSGIGLSIARQIMLLHGGRLQLTDNRDGRVAFRMIFK